MVSKLRMRIDGSERTVVRGERSMTVLMSA